MKFTKMHGNGNDYIYMDGINNKLPELSSLAIKLSDRHFSIGSDGLIVAEASDNADLRMSMYNADGSEGMMCGNGIRCLARFAYDKGLVNKTEFDISTLSGIKRVSLFMKDGEVDEVGVEMGSPIFTPKDIPTLVEGDDAFNQTINYLDIEIKANSLSMGNPHTVIFLNEQKKEILDRIIYDEKTTEGYCMSEPYILLNYLPLSALGSYIENHEIFPKRTNVEFVEIISRNRVGFRVWERGGYETLACGTGACAVVVAGVEKGLLDPNVRVDTLGGYLTINYDKAKGSVYMRGKASYSYEGDIVL